MKVLVRKSVAGAEYWDTEEKRSIFVPKGRNPDFEVSENPASMITPETQSVGTITAEVISNALVGKTNETPQPLDSEKANEVLAKVGNTVVDDLESKNVKELRALAAKDGIDIPNAIRTKGDIINIINSAR